MFKVICQRRHLRIFSLYETGEKKIFFLVAPGTRLSYLPQRLIHVPNMFKVIYDHDQMTLNSVIFLP